MHCGMTGYLHPLYAKSLSEFGTPVELPQCGGWLLERRIPNSDLKDAIGCYPLFCCADWTKLPADIQKIKDRYVTISVTPDPFAPITAADLSQYFQLVHPFKKHFVIDISDSTDGHINRHHRYYARKALKQMQVRLVEDPKAALDGWVPGLVAFQASRNGKTIGMHLWYIQSGVAYSHLGASDQEGYSLGAAYALHWSAITEFKQHHAGAVRWIDLGAGAGMEETARDGLSRFKHGWATGEKVKYFCGSVCNWANYQLLTGTDQITSGYFPLYRIGELS